MDIRRVKTCEKCKTVVPLDKVRLFPKDANTSLLVCDACCETLKKQREGSIPPAASVRNMPNEFTLKYCTRCKYSFRVDLSKVGLRQNLFCPYCGKDDRLTKKA